MLVNKVIFLPENDLLIKSVISIHRRFKFSTNIQQPNCLYPPTPDRRQSKTFLTIDERHRRQGIWTPPPPPPPVEKIQKYRVSKAILVRIPCKITKLQMYKSSIQCWATIGPPAKRHVAFRWQVVGGPLIVVFGSSLLPSLT